MRGEESGGDDEWERCEWGEEDVRKEKDLENATRPKRPVTGAS